jgi:hypothetical protein
MSDAAGLQSLDVAENLWRLAVKDARFELDKVRWREAKRNSTPTLRRSGFRPKRRSASSTSIRTCSNTRYGFGRSLISHRLLPRVRLRRWFGTSSNTLASGKPAKGMLANANSLDCGNSLTAR